MTAVVYIILEIIGYIFISIGTFFLLLASIGLIRMPDVYNRMQTATKATTLGALSVLVGIGLIDLWWLPKSLILAIFIVLTAPIGASALARASYKHGVKLWKGSVVDKYKDEKEED